jgi:hypothetical protein
LSISNVEEIRPIFSIIDARAVNATRYKQWAHDRLEAAKAAAPLFHPKLQSIEITGGDGEGLNSNHTVQIEFVEPTLRQTGAQLDD